MKHNYIFTDVNAALPTLLDDLYRADEVGSRAGRTQEMTHVGITLTSPMNRAILLSERKASLAAQIAESMWVLAGRSDIDWLGHYLPRARDFSDDGTTWRAGYGQRLRSWPKRDGSDDVVDQFRFVIEHLAEKHSSRQAVMSIWDPVVDTAPGKDIPCNDWLSFSSRLGYLDLHVALRSNDIIWGWSGINQFEWSVMLEVAAGLLGVGVGSLHFSTTSFHLYQHHWAKGRNIIAKSSTQAVEPSPRFDAGALPSRTVDGLDWALGRWFDIEEGIRLGIDMDKSVEAFPEPMLRSYLRVLQWWWTGDRDYLDSLRGTDLEEAALVGLQPPAREAEAPERTVSERGLLAHPTSDFLAHAVNLHDHKHLAYGNSWKKRGESVGIMANIARKVDRLGRSATMDETSADTAMDLFVYLAKYRVWVAERTGEAPVGSSEDTDAANAVMGHIEAGFRVEAPDTKSVRFLTDFELEETLRSDFDLLQNIVETEPMTSTGRQTMITKMLFGSYVLARRLFEAGQ